MATTKTPRGIRLNNPGCMRITNDPWQGLDYPGTKQDGELFAFVDAPSGIRAIVRTLITYQDKHGLHTVADMINRWAPPSENPRSSSMPGGMTVGKGCADAVP